MLLPLSLQHVLLRPQSLQLFADVGAAHLVQVISTGTFFSGMETIKWALADLKVKSKPMFVAETNKDCVAFIKQNIDIDESMVFGDVAGIDKDSLPTCDVFAAGFPCQPFSMAGKQQGKDDQKGRGTMFDHCAEYIQKKEPPIFVLENVGSLKKVGKFKKYHKSIMARLRDVGDGKYQVATGGYSGGRGALYRQVPDQKSSICGSEFGPWDPSSCVGLVLLFILVVLSATQLNSGPTFSCPDFCGVRTQNLRQ
jgi:hypothetical protein